MNILKYIALAIVFTSVHSADEIDRKNDEKTKRRSKTRSISDAKRDFKFPSDNNIIIFNKEDNKNSESIIEQSQISSSDEIGVEDPVVTSLLSRVRRGDPQKGSKNKKKCKPDEKCKRKKGRKRRKKKKKRLGRRKNKDKKRKRGKKRKKGRKIDKHVETFTNQTLVPAALKGIDEECVQSAECMPGLCCARRKWKRWCRPLLKLNETCMGPDLKHKKRSPDEHYQLCPCEDGLTCAKVNDHPRSRLSACKIPVT